MSGYRAAPEGAKAIYDGARYVCHGQLNGRGAWFLDVVAFVAGRESQRVCALLDHGYWSRTDALESAAQACEAVGLLSDVAALGTAKHCADAIRKLKEST